jgi:hypothetical protein
MSPVTKRSSGRKIPVKRLTPARWPRFLDALSTTGNVTWAAATVGMTRAEVLGLRAGDETLARQWDDAIEVAADALEAEARRRALEGWLEPVFYQGQQVGEVRKYSDRMLELLLKAQRPEKFQGPARAHGSRRRTHPHRGPERAWRRRAGTPDFRSAGARTARRGEGINPDATHPWVMEPVSNAGSFFV